MSASRFSLRLAKRHERAAIEAMQQRSLRALAAGHYAPAEIEAFCALGTLDEVLFDEGHFFVASDGEVAVAGCGAWSRLVPHYAAALPFRAARRPREATVRSVYVEPQHARRGVATALMARIEADARAHGIVRLKLEATRPALRLYESLGYRADGPADLTFADGAVFSCIAMSKALDASHDSERRAA